MSAVPRAAAALSPCARCAQAQRTCCQRAEVLLTEGDVARIRAYTGRADFAERRAPADPEYLAPDPEDPHWLALTARTDGTRRMLKRRPDGDCGFLGAAGCELPGSVRPLVCRLYPWDYTESGLTGSAGEYCPSQLLGSAGRPMTEVLGIRAEEARRWHAQLYRELRHGSP